MKVKILRQTYQRRTYSEVRQKDHNFHFELTERSTYLI